jgi:CBS domain-containing protein
MLVKEIMTAPVITVSLEATLGDAIALLVEHKLSGLPVLDDLGQLVGIISEGDLLRRMELGTAIEPTHWWERLFSSVDSAEAYRLTNGRKVSDVMTSSPITITDASSLAQAAGLMEKHRIKRLPVMNDGQLVGLVSRADFVRALQIFVARDNEKPAISDEEIKKRILAELHQQSWASDCSFDVHVNDGRVWLHGLAVTDNQRRAARVAAENVIGVRSVDDEIVVVRPELAGL